MTTQLTRQALLAAAAALTVVTCLSCAADRGPHVQGTRVSPAEPDASQEISVEQLFANLHYRYVEAETTAEMAEWPPVHVVVSGEVTGFVEGPSYVPVEEGDLGNVVMSVSVEDVFKGDPKPGDTVDVIMYSGSRTAEQFEEALRGSRVALYLSPAVDLPREVAEGLWTPVTPQGFVVEEADGEGVVFPQEHRSLVHSTLEAQLPGKR